MKNRWRTILYICNYLNEKLEDEEIHTQFFLEFFNDFKPNPVQQIDSAFSFKLDLNLGSIIIPPRNFFYL